MWICRFFVVFCLIWGAFQTAFAQSVDVSALKIEGFVKGTRYEFNPAYAEKYDVKVPAAFSFIAPTSDEHMNFVKPAPGGVGIFKIFFTTTEKQVKSNLQFVPFTVAMGPVDERLDSLKVQLNNAFVASVPDPDRSEINAMRKTEIGPYPAIEVFGRYDAGEDGIVVLRITAIPHPENENGVVAIINGLTKNFPMQKVGDVLNTDASKALTTFRFQ